MVGPGLPKNVIEQKMTIHADILPTILHVLAGRRIPIAGSHGVDLLEPSSLTRRSSLLLTHHTKTEPYQVVLLQADKRLRLTLSLSKNVIKIVGLVDEKDKLMFPLLPKPQEAPIWAESFNEQIRTLTR
jgi:hypothetical protein